MRRREDDLTAWQDDPVVRALNAPATDSELTGEEAALAAFRAAVPTSARRRYAGRLGVGGSALAIAIALSGGVAAAYTAALPSSLQRVAHDLGGWAAVPAAEPLHSRRVAAKHHPTLNPTQTPAPISSTTAAVAPLPSPVVSPTASPAAHHHPGTHQTSRPSEKPTSGVSVAPPTSTPSPTPPPTPTPTPTIIPTPVVAGSITITVGVTKVAVNGTVAVAGRLATASGAPLAHQRVWLIERLAGESTASQVAMGMTQSDGAVLLTTPALTHSVRLRLVAAQHVRSAAVGVVVMPTVTASASPVGLADVISVSTDGGDPGDSVTLEQREAGRWVTVTTGALDANGGVSFSVQPPVKRPAHYRVVLPRTVAHGAATTRVTAPPI